MFYIFFPNFYMLSELHSLEFKLCSNPFIKIVLLHLIMVPQLSGGWRHNYMTKTRQVGFPNEQSMYSLKSVVSDEKKFINVVTGR
jgi:hypothetical protein